MKMRHGIWFSQPPMNHAGLFEGVFGWLAEVAVPRATTLIWLDVP